MKTYLKTLIEEKGASISEEILLEGHFGLTWSDLINFIDQATDYHKKIRETLEMIDFQNGDVFNYLNFLANGLVKALDYEASSII